MDKGFTRGDQYELWDLAVLKNVGGGRGEKLAFKKDSRLCSFSTLEKVFKLKATVRGNFTDSKRKVESKCTKES